MICQGFFGRKRLFFLDQIGQVIVAWFFDGFWRQNLSVLGLSFCLEGFGLFHS
jgi:hypothetical protein